ncbi:MAG: sigma 54-interacting transcriptional regulator [Deltaproteobacteria bacterium]|nr:sigma 54-interacting transcriptional regulator [Deltaproteobacteria bacterium]
MVDLTRTAPVDDHARDERDLAARPGLVAVCSSGPLSVPFPLGARVGRDALADLGVLDDQMSRVHVALTQRAGALVLEDQGSRNGTFVRGVRIESATTVEPGDIVRCGRTLFVVSADVTPFVSATVRVVNDEVRSPVLDRVLDKARAMSAMAQLLVTGESGAGKEHVARAFHEGAGGKGAFIAINCATISGNLAERLLFGARRGAYTGADSDAEGYVRAAEHGTLFLDEVGELEASVQAKLLRFLETKQYFAVGDTRPRHAHVRMCFATLRDLAGEVRARRFREDLYHRIATPLLEVPPLRARREEIPHLVDLEIARANVPVRASTAFFEAALSATWPGNVRQLRRTVAAALLAAHAEGRTSLVAYDLPADLTRPDDETGTDETTDPTADPTDDDIRIALSSAGGNVSVAARALGIHRSRLRRWITKHNG